MIRLLQRDASGLFSLFEFEEDSQPRYAILSHTWGLKDDEVTYSDIIGNTNEYTRKKGFKKLEFCATQAASHEMEYF
jgi:hypothetical protein